MKRYGVNWLRVWLGKVGCLAPFVIAIIDLTGSLSFFSYQLLIFCSVSVYGKYKTVRDECQQIEYDSARLKLLAQRRLTLASRPKNQSATILYAYLALVAILLVAAFIASFQLWLSDTVLTKAILYAFGAPAISLGSLMVEMREINNSDANQELDRLIALEDAATQQTQTAEPTTIVESTATIAPAHVTKISTEELPQATKRLL